MTPTTMTLEFGFCEHRVVDYDVGPLNETHHILVIRTRLVLGVRDVADAVSPVLDPIAGCPAGMTKRRSAYRDSGPWSQCLADLEVKECDVCGKDLRRHRVKRRAHEVADCLLRVAVRHLVSGPQSERVAAPKGEREERQAEHVVDMCVRQEQVDLRASFVDEGRSKLPKTRARVEDQHHVPATDLDTGSVAAVAYVAGTGDRDTSPHTPEPDEQVAR